MSDGQIVFTARNGDYWFQHFYPKDDIPPHNSDYGLIAHAMFSHDEVLPTINAANNPSKIKQRKEQDEAWQRIVKWMNKPEIK